MGIGVMPHYVEFNGFMVSQTLITSFLSLIFFGLFVLIFNKIKSKNNESLLVVVVEMLIEEMNKFFGSISEKVPNSAKIFVLFLFFYILWNNLFGLIVDLFAAVNPVLHKYVRPVTTDIMFNAMLAVFGVLRALLYGFKVHGLYFIGKYLPLKGIGIAGKRPSGFKVILWIFVKILDIFLGLFIGFLEFIGEFTKMLSLTLRLFGNIFAGMVLIGLVVYATIAFIKIPLLGPFAVIVLEILVGILQAFVFALLVMVYFKLAEESH